jgi:hypothetical protein
MAKPQLSREEQLVAFFVTIGSGKVGRTQLMKYLYMADYEARRYLGKPISNLEYVWYHYGPFDDKVQQLVDGLEQRQLIQESAVQFPTGQVGYRYSVGQHQPGVAFGFSAVELQILKYVYDTYSRMPLRAFLDDVVYETEPMKRAREADARNQPLDMSMVDNAKRDRYGITFEELFDRVQRVRGGEFRTHAEVMADMRPRVNVAA